MFVRSFVHMISNGTTYMPGSSFESASDYFPRDGDIHIFFLSANGIRFEAPVDDLWYRAMSPAKPIVRATQSGWSPDLPAYRPDAAASPLACFQQFQFCDASKSRCGPLSSWLDAQIGAGELFGITLDSEKPPLENNPASRFYWFVSLMSYAVPGLGLILLHLGANSLASTRSLFSGVMGPLPSDQWQVDVMQWWATYLAGIQGGVVSTASGPVDSSLEHLRIKPCNEWIQYHICDNQVSLLSF